MAAVQAPVEVFFECPSTELKRLGFVENAASNSMSYVTGSTAFAKACGYYSSAKDTSMLKGSLTKIEDLIMAYGKPVVSKVSEKYPSYMTTVDTKVDTAVTILQDIWANKIVASTPGTWAKSVIAQTPTSIEELSQAREEYFKKIELTLQALKDRAVALPADLTAAITAAIANARSNIEDAHLFDRVKAAYDAVLKYPAVVAVIEKTAPVAAKAVDMATPYVTTAKDMATPYVTKAVEVATPYATKAVDMATPYVEYAKNKVWAAPAGQVESTQ